MGLFGSGNKDKKIDRNPHTAGGPVVKSGPTNGTVRSRNSDGSWRKKRSDAGTPRGSRK